MGKSDGPDVLLLGIDAACHSVVEPLVEEGAIPNLAALFEKGAVGPLASQIPPWTPSAWPSLFTGVNPGQHGVFGFLTFDGYDWRVVDRTDVRELALWELLDAHDMSSVVVNVPVTHPPDEIDGAVVPGYISPEDPDCHPPGLLEEIREAVGDYQIYPPEPADRAERVEGYRTQTRMRGDAFRYLCDKFDPEFGFVQFQHTDTVFHELPGDEDAVKAVYEAVDDEVGSILDRYDPELVVVASDHGIGPYSGPEFRVNDYLRTHDFVETTTSGDGMPGWSTIARNRLQNGEKGEKGGQPPIAKAFALLSQVGLTSQRIERLLRTVRLDGIVGEMVSNDIARAASERVDFENSTAYMRARVECGVRINLEGREPNGIVAQENYEEVRDELIAVLEAAETPDGDPVFDRVQPREDVFDGPFVDDVADVIVVPADFDQYLSSSLHGSAFGPRSEPYNHKETGLVAMAGPEIEADRDISGGSLLDIAPTILSALDVPLNSRMDGEPLPGISPTETQSYPKPTAMTADDTGGDEAVENRLANLGYLE